VAAFSYLLSRFIFLSLPFGYEVAILLAAMACVWQGARTFEGRGRNQVVVAAPSPAGAGPESQESVPIGVPCGQSSPRGVMLPRHAHHQRSARHQPGDPTTSDVGFLSEKGAAPKPMPLASPVGLDDHAKKPCTGNAGLSRGLH
jgi:hypothetical protein